MKSGAVDRVVLPVPDGVEVVVTAAGQVVVVGAGGVVDAVGGDLNLELGVLTEDVRFQLGFKSQPVDRIRGIRNQLP